MDRHEFYERFLRAAAGCLSDFFATLGNDGEFMRPVERQDGGELRLAANCSDLFAWGCADSEPVTPENIETLERARADLLATGAFEAETLFLANLFACRVRGEQPMAPYFGSWEKIGDEEIAPCLSLFRDGALKPNGYDARCKELFAASKDTP